MVYRGKISPDCLPCRRRKLRCDLQKQGCGQCRRAKIVCQGYRDPNQTVFRDETQAAGRKVAAREASRWHAAHQRQQQQQQKCKLPLAAGSQSSSAVPASSSVVAIARTSVPRLQVAWDVQARDAFFAHYVFGFTHSYDVLATLYLEPSAASDALTASVDAVSLAFLLQQRVPPGTISTSSSLHVLARERYLVALRSLGEALASPDTAATDSTLQAALLLDLYEKLRMRQHEYLPPVESGDRPQDAYASLQRSNGRARADKAHIKVSAWMSHIQGALSLLALRGTRNTETYVGRRLASRLITNLIISCATTDVRFPPALIAFRTALGRFHENDPKWAITGVVAELINLRADLREEAQKRRHGDRTAPETNSSFPSFNPVPVSSASSTSTWALGRLAELEKRLVDLDHSLPPSWQTTRVYLDTGGTKSDTGRAEPIPPASRACQATLPLLHPYYDLYGDHFKAQTRNVGRMTRIAIRQMTHNLTSAHPDVDSVAGQFGLDMESDMGSNCENGRRQDQRRTFIWAGTDHKRRGNDGDDDDDDDRMTGLITWRDDVIEQVCRDICDSAPQFLQVGARPGNQLPFGPLQTLQCYTLIKPLHIVGSISGDKRVREWAIAALEYIAEHGGVSVSKAVADLLRTEPDTSAWRVYTMLGGYALAA